MPVLDPSAVLFSGAVITGDVTLREDVSVWYNAVLRGDAASIEVGSGSNIQECCVLHVDKNHPLCLGQNVTVGHGAILHGCTVGDNTLVGMGAIVMNGANIGKNCLIAAGALVLQNTAVPDGSVVWGSPAQVARAITPDEIAQSKESALHYQQLSKQAGTGGGKKA